ncbi:sucrase ferredoxin [Yimella sp. cx-573]|nr:sucrase ferredoxin [Yimella sp. cx-573]
MAEPTQCSRQWDDADLNAAGSASVAQFWVALEQNGPWGHDAIASSHLPDGVGPALERAVAEAGGRLLLIRRPGRHADDHQSGDARTCLIAGGLADDPWLLEGDVDNPSDLLRVDWRLSIGAGPDAVSEVLPLLEETRDVALLVCANSKRDQCCAVRGRPVAAHAAEQRPGRVWECSHTGGHRFAPTAVMLPSGQTYARLDESSAVEAYDAEKRREVAASLNALRHNRGRSCLILSFQAAEAAIRQETGELALDAFTVTEEEPDELRVEHRDGRVWRVQVAQHPGPDLKDSCLKQPKPSSYWTAQLLSSLV